MATQPYLVKRDFSDPAFTPAIELHIGEVAMLEDSIANHIMRNAPDAIELYTGCVPITKPAPFIGAGPQEKITRATFKAVRPRRN